jgi:hypothetical protein
MRRMRMGRKKTTTPKTASKGKVKVSNPVAEKKKTVPYPKVVETGGHT